MRSIDQLVDTLLKEKKVACEPLPAGERARWIELVRERVLARPELGKKLF
jgi:hypothetical protein